MKTKLMHELIKRAALLLALSTLIYQPSTALAQGTAFTYQGRLNDGGNPANGTYDLRFSIYDSTNVPGNLVAGPITNSATLVSNGLFTVTLDFGAGVFTGPDRWLEIAARPSGPGSFTGLNPRQRITPAPYAIYAGAAGAYTGAIADGQLSGNIARLNGSQVFTGSLLFANTNNTYSGTFIGSGAGVTGVKLTSLNSFGAIRGGDFQPALAVNAITDPLSVAAGDVNGDGLVDLVCGGGVEPSVAVLTNNSGGGFAMSALFDTGGIRTSVALADLNEDGWPDLATVSDITRTLVVLTNNHSGGFNFYFTNALSIGAPQSVAAADVNGDGKLDLICYSTVTLSVHTNSGNGRCVPASTNNVANSAGNGPNSLAMADVNGDGWVDAIVVNTTASALLVLTNNRSGRFVAASTNSVGVDPRSVVAADVNGDGWVDLISGDFGFGTGNTLTVLTNNGSGGFAFSSAPSVAAVPFSGASVGAADLNQDGWVDLFSVNWNGDSASVLLNNRSGGFAPATLYGAGDVPISVMATDVNGDGWPDLVCGKSGLGAAGTPNTLSILLNRPVFNGAFFGNGAGVTNLDASQIANGTLADARLSTNVALRNASQAFTGTNTFSRVTLGGLYSLTPGTLAPTAGSTLTPTNSFIRLNPAAPVTLNATTAISDGDTPGVVLMLQGMNNVNTVTLNDGANVQLGAASRVLGQDDTLVLIWNGTDWIEVSFANN